MKPTTKSLNLPITPEEIEFGLEQMDELGHPGIYYGHEIHGDKATATAHVPRIKPHGFGTDLRLLNSPDGSFEVRTGFSPIDDVSKLFGILGNIAGVSPERAEEATQEFNEAFRRDIGAETGPCNMRYETAAGFIVSSLHMPKGTRSNGHDSKIIAPGLITGRPDKRTGVVYGKKAIMPWAIVSFNK